MEYGKSLEIDKIKEISVNILKDVADFCENHNITYFLACGTLLGAAKYGGYIPWDDDVDIMMPRPDYVRFLNEYRSDKYFLLKPEEGRLPYAKIYDSSTIKIEYGLDYGKNKKIGVDIDLFPLDGAIDDISVMNRIIKRSRVLELLLRLSNQPIFYRKNPLKAINRIIPRIIGSKRLVRMIEKNAQTYKYENSDYVVRVRNSPNGFSGILRKEFYIEPIFLMFEGKKYRVPKEYDRCLKEFYGENYFTELPPEEKRVSHHHNKVYWKDNYSA